jgi:hypothetical protein
MFFSFLPSKTANLKRVKVPGLPVGVTPSGATAHFMTNRAEMQDKAPKGGSNGF